MQIQLVVHERFQEKIMRRVFLVGLIIIGLLKGFDFIGKHHLPIYHVPLDESSIVTLDWMVDYHRENVIFEIHLPSDFGWFAFGFSDRGKLFPADYCVLWRDLKGNFILQDTWSDEEGVLHLDKQQDCNGFRIKHRNDITKFTYQRKFETCDLNDYLIEDGTTHIVWTKGKSIIYKPEGVNISTTHKNNGMVRVQLLKKDSPETKLPKDVFTLDVVTDKVKVPAAETTYWCHVHKLPESFKNKHHVFQYEPVIQKGNEGLVHHMEVFHCIAPADDQIPSYVGSCFESQRPKKTQLCKRVIAAWAMGAKPFTYPEEAGLPIGGKDFNLFVMLEVHYNNPEEKADYIDSSGIRFHVSSKLRTMDAGVIELGLEYTDKMAIPPNQKEFSLSGYCIAECTYVALPQTGITIFASQLHTHLTGVRVYTRLLDALGNDLMELNRDDHFSTHFQEIRKLKQPIKVFPNQVLVTTCDYNTEERENVTLGGFAISDEMCVNYIHYYPAISLEVCKSSIADKALQTYFQYMNHWEDQPTSPDKGISDNYHSIEWNPMRVQLLSDVYNEAPLSMQCNMSSGDRFPGYWENAPISIVHPLIVKPRNCPSLK